MPQSPEDDSGATAAAIIGANRPATIVRNLRTPRQQRWQTQTGGNFSDLALFLKHDEVQIGDEVYCDCFDEPRVVAWVTPVVVQHGLSHWRAKLMRRSEWRSLTNIPKPYPRWKYQWSRVGKIVNSLEEEVALGGGWADTPGEFEPFREPVKPGSKPPNPAKWVAGWLPGVLSAEHPKKIEACVWTAHSVFWREANYPASTAESMRTAFNGIAGVLFDAGILTESRLTEDIPALVWDSAIAAGWWHHASELPQSIFPEKVGHYWVWWDESRDWPNLFRSEIAGWRAKLLLAPKDESGKAIGQLPQNPGLPANNREIAPAVGGNPQGRKPDSEAATQDEAEPPAGADGDETTPRIASIPVEQAERARNRQAVVLPILAEKRWKRGRWATEAGVGKNSVYKYLDGTRKLTPENRRAMAEAIDLQAEKLPE
jgi:hypothetical protein